MKKFGGFLLAAIACTIIPTIAWTENLSNREVDRLIPKFPIVKWKKAKNNIVLSPLTDSEIETLKAPSHEITLKLRPKSGIRLTSEKKKAFLDPELPIGTRLFEITETATNTILYCTDHNIHNFRKCYGDVNNDNILDYEVDGQNSSQNIITRDSIKESLKYAILYVSGVALTMPIPMRPSYEAIDSNAFQPVTIKYRITQKNNGEFQFTMVSLKDDNSEDVILLYDIKHFDNPTSNIVDFGAFSLKLDTTATTATISLDKANYDGTLINLDMRSFSPLPIFILLM